MLACMAEASVESSKERQGIAGMNGHAVAPCHNQILTNLHRYPQSMGIDLPYWPSYT